MTSKFIADFHKALQPAARKKHTRVVSVCGVSAAETVQSLCEQANESIENLQARALPVKNSFFGESVTCTGLLTGQDFLAALQAEKGSYDEVILASDTLKSFEEVFLCGMTLKDLKKNLRGSRIFVNASGGEGFFRLLAGKK